LIPIKRAAGPPREREPLTGERRARIGVKSAHRNAAEHPPMKSVAQILAAKPEKAVHSISPAASVYDAVKLMAEKGIGALLVMDQDAVAGIITERDYARKIILMGRSSKETPVRQIMTFPVLYVRPDQTNEECMALMTDNRVRHLPVMDGGKLVGLVSIGDLVKDIISEQKFIIDQLEHYIRGDRG
jgi:CBS domain-containing protein